MTELRISLEALLAKHGYGDFWYEIKSMNGKRLQNPGREKRKRIPDGIKKKLYIKQEGLCANPKCSKHCSVRELEGDHIDPNRQDFNSARNWQLLCKPCNGMKSAMSVEEWSKLTGQTTIEILGYE